MQFANEKEQRIKELENENKLLLEKVKQLEHNVESLTQAILQASKQRFGASSEKTPRAEGQCSIFGEEAENYGFFNGIHAITSKEHKRSIRKKGSRAKLTALV